MQVVLVLIVCGSDKNIAITRIIDIPISPFPGLTISGIADETTGQLDWPVEAVCWDNKSRKITCYMQVDDTDDRMRTAQEIIDDDWGPEWELDES
jgi:hypothetical protein